MALTGVKSLSPALILHAPQKVSVTVHEAACGRPLCPDSFAVAPNLRPPPGVALRRAHTAALAVVPMLRRVMRRSVLPRTVLR